MIVKIAALSTLLFSMYPADVFAGEPTPQTNALAIDTIWVLIAGFLVFIMHAGFALVEAGFTRAKNTVNILTKNILTISIGFLLFFASGFAVAFGGDFAGFMGYKGFFLAGIEEFDFGIPFFAFWFFQAAFCATAATIVSGAMAERTKIISYLLFTLIVTAFIYPVVVHWVWSEHWWLSAMGFVDFAGSTVVHGVGGWSALVGAYLVGARYNKYSEDGRVRVIPGHNIPLGALGTLLLWFGWFGFNPGSTLSGTTADVTWVVATTVLAAASGAVSTAVFTWHRYGRPDLALILNGALGGVGGHHCRYIGCNSDGGGNNWPNSRYNPALIGGIH